MDSEITLRIENGGGDWDETQNGAHVMRRKGCAMQNQGITIKIKRRESMIERIVAKRWLSGGKNYWYIDWSNDSFVAEDLVLEVILRM